MKKIICLIGIITMMFSMTIFVFAGDVPEALNYEDDAKLFVGVLKDFKLDNASSPKIQDVQVLPVHKLKGEVALNEIQSYQVCYFGKVTPKKDSEYLFGWLGENSVWAYAIESRDGNKIKLKITDEFAERIQNSLDNGLYERSERRRMEKPKEIERLKNAKVLADLFVLDRNEIEQIAVIYPGEGDPAGCYLDKDEFLNLAEKIELLPIKTSASTLLGSSGILLMPQNADNKEYNVWIDRNATVASQLAISSEGNAEYGISKADFWELYAFLPKEATKHLMLENQLREYKIIIAGAFLLVVILVLFIGFAVSRKRKSAFKNRSSDDSLSAKKKRTSK